MRPPSVWAQQAMLAALIRRGALSELAYETSGRCRCGTLLLYQAPKLWGSGFRITTLTCGGAMGIRTPDLLHAIGTLLGSLAAACPAEAAAAIGLAPAAACSGPKPAAEDRKSTPLNSSHP